LTRSKRETYNKKNQEAPMAGTFSDDPAVKAVRDGDRKLEDLARIGAETAAISERRHPEQLAKTASSTSILPSGRKAGAVNLPRAIDIVTAAGEQPRRRANSLFETVALTLQT
jgi:hypothetical protein